MSGGDLSPEQWYGEQREDDSQPRDAIINVTHIDPTLDPVSVGRGMTVTFWMLVVLVSLAGFGLGALITLVIVR